MNPVERMRRVIARVEGARGRNALQEIIAKSEAKVMDFEAIPIDQLKGDIGRSGYSIKQMLAVDIDNRRLLFTDHKNQHLYAEFGAKSEGYKVSHIGHQAAIAKEYDPVDLEPTTESGNYGETVTTAHEEEDDPDFVGVVGGTPTVQPEEDDRGFGGDKREPARVEAMVRALEHELYGEPEGEEHVCK